MLEAVYRCVIKWCSVTDLVTIYANTGMLFRGTKVTENVTI